LNGDILDKEHGKQVIDLMILKLQKMNSFLEGVVTYWDEWAAKGAGVEKKTADEEGHETTDEKYLEKTDVESEKDGKEPSDKKDGKDEDEEMPYKTKDAAEETKGSGEKEEDSSDKEKEEKEDKDDEKEKDAEKDEKEVPPSDRVMGEQYFDYYNGKH